MAHRFLVETLTPTIRHVATVGINSGGSSYAVDDILTAVGGTGTAATFRVTSVNSGVIDGISIETSGLYTVDPTLIANTVTGGSGSGATLDLTTLLEQTYIMGGKAIMDAATAGRVTGVSIVSGGTGYVVDDEVTLSGGTTVSGFASRFRVTSVNAGVVDGIEPVSCGAYSTLPDVTAASHATTGGTGANNLTVSVSVEGPRDATPVAGGTGYVVGDVITVSGGTLHAGESAFQFVVTAHTGGVVDTLRPLRIGRYDTLPTDPASTTGGTGTGLTVNLVKFSFEHPDAASEDYFDGITEFEYYIEGTNLAGVNPMCGMKVKQFGSSSNRPMWGLKVATAFDDMVTFENQVGSSPGDFSLTTSAALGPLIPHTTLGSMTLFLSVMPRRIAGVSRTAPTYETFYLGCFTPFIDSPSTRYPAPFMVAGTVADPDIDITAAFSGKNVNIESTMHTSFMHYGENSPTTPVHCIREQSGAWRQFEPEQSGDTPVMRLWPFDGELILINGAPNISAGAGTIGSPTAGNLPQDVRVVEYTNSTTNLNLFNNASHLYPSPFGVNGADLYKFDPAIIIKEDSGAIHDIYGEVEGFFAVVAVDLNAEDRQIDSDGNQFMVYPDTNTAENALHIAILEGDNGL